MTAGARFLGFTRAELVVLASALDDRLRAGLDDVHTETRYRDADVTEPASLLLALTSELHAAFAPYLDDVPEDEVTAALADLDLLGP